MKTYRNIIFAIMALAAVACSKPETPETDRPQDAPVDDPVVETVPTAIFSTLLQIMSIMFLSLRTIR